MTPGSRLGPFQIVEAIGAGGMGEVYRATDTRLKRQVAIKVLASSVTADADRLARLQREAELLASLNHPNIAALYGIEESRGDKALVMELVEGATLAERIAQGPVPLAEALTIARQIADALAAAHDRNIIHRDLKPANIKLQPDGDVKVLDFGLAKAMTLDEPNGSSLQQTVTSPAMTMHGVILGTAAYMSPEQAAGRAIDRRTDLWAFGAVLMEMLTGRQVFAGDSVSEVIASVLKDEPDWAALPASTPASIHRLLRRCLERDRRRRWPDAATARMECDDALVAAELPPPPSASSPVVGSWWPVAVALLAGVAIAGVAAWTRWPVADRPQITRFEIELPDNRVFTRTGRHVVAISPDGSHIAYVANRQIFLRTVSDIAAVALDGTAQTDPSSPVFSPAGTWLAFWTNGEIKKVPVSGGTAVTLARAGNPFGMTWTGDRITLAVDNPPRIISIPADGGAGESTLIGLEADELAQTPQLLHGGRTVLFTLFKGELPGFTQSSSWQDAKVVAQELSSGRRVLLVDGGTDARALASGHLVYERESTLFAIAFDQERLAVIGSPAPVQADVQEALGGFTGAAQVAISDNGSLVYVPGVAGLGGSMSRELMWLDRSGATERLKFAPAMHFTGRSQRLSPDAKRIVSRVIGGSSADTDLWVGELAQGIFRRLTFSGRATDPVWSADGSEICYEQLDEVVCQPADGGGAPRALFKKSRVSTLEDRSADGRWLLFSVQPDSTARFLTHITDISSPATVRQLSGDGTAVRVPSVSPDGRWIAYVTGDSSGDGIYVRPFPAFEGGLWQVAPAGADRPSWSPNGRELFYLAAASGGGTADVTVMRVAVSTGPTFSAGAPEPVVKLPPNAAFNFSAGPDGRFLINVPAAGVMSSRDRLIVVQNWFEELKAKVPR